jgi:hypothetical protein
MKVSKQLERLDPKVVMAELAVFGHAMLQAQVDRELIERMITGMAFPDEPRRGWFIYFARGAFCGDVEVFGPAAQNFLETPHLDAEAKTEIVVLSIVTAGRIKERSGGRI